MNQSALVSSKHPDTSPQVLTETLLAAYSASETIRAKLEALSHCMTLAANSWEADGMPSRANCVGLLGVFSDCLSVLRCDIDELAEDISSDLFMATGKSAAELQSCGKPDSV